MAVIPIPYTSTPPPGMVIAWDSESRNNNIAPDGGWPQRFTVGAPETGSFSNYVITIPPGFGDIFCSGHVWMPDGRLFVAGGTTRYGNNTVSPPLSFLGSRFVGIWDPTNVGVAPNYGWTILCDPMGQNKPMQIARWYPTVTLLGNNKIMVSGGVVDDSHDCQSTPPDSAIDSYEVWDIGANDWERNGGIGIVYAGPDPSNISSCFSLFGEYPRQQLVSSGHLFMSGQFSGANRVHHATSPGVWLTGSQILGSGGYRSYGSSVLVPNVGRRPINQDKVMILGGSDNVNSTNTVQACDAVNGTGSGAWSSLPSLNVARMVANTVLLPDGATLVIGGCTGTDYFATIRSGGTPVAEMRPEVYRRSINAWVLQNPQSSSRMYHSTAALLPSGKVVSGGGDIKTFDWEVFTPDYLPSISTPRPAFASTVGPSLTFDTSYSISYVPMPAGLHVDRVVLMCPCSVTHHSDMDQRYVELAQVSGVPPPNTINVRTPPLHPTSTAQGSVEAPPGWYMIFLISNTGTPSIAQWVQLL